MTIAVALAVEADAWRAVPDLETLVDQALGRAAASSGAAVASSAEVSVLLCDDAAIRALNRDWRGIDKPTNVLSFPAAGPIARRPLLGDIAVAWETTRREAETDHRTVSDHLAHLLVHGFLHLVGFDHESEAEALSMETLETRILADLGIADPYDGSEPIGRPAP